MSFWNCFKLEKGKRAIVSSPTFEIQAKTWERGEMDAIAIFEGFGEREGGFSLKYRAIRPSKSFEPRRKAALREEAYAWTPVLGSFVKLREVGVSSYLGFTLCLSVFTMFELDEAVRGRLIGSKAWNRGGKF